MAGRVAKHLRSNIVAYGALFLALGGTAYAIERNSVMSKHIAPQQVKQPDLAAPAGWQEAGLRPCVFDGPQWSNYGGDNTAAAFRRDPYGTVHIKGSVTCGIEASLADRHVFDLPPGFRPGEIENHPSIGNFSSPESVRTRTIAIHPDGRVRVATGAWLDDRTDPVYLDGITFRCAPSGQDGCP